MRNEFYKIYKEIFDYYYRFPINTYIFYPEYYLLKQLKDYIKNIDVHLLRPDAKYYLLVNLHQLLIRPIIRSSYEINNEELDKIIKQDINMIIDNISESFHDRPISSHQIMKKIDELWGKLQTTKFELWG